MFKQVRRFLGKAYRVAKLFTNPTKYVSNLITDTIRDVGTKYPPQVRNVLLKHGNHKIIDIKLCREPILSNTDFLLKALSGKNSWEEAKRKYGFDRFYHLFMIVTMEDGSRLHVEKNEIIRISENPRACPDALDLGAPSQPITVNELLDRTKQTVGESNFFTYDPFKNNCQNFISYLLRTMGLYTDSASKFVYQDVAGLLSGLPSYVNPITKGITTAGAFLNTAYQKTKDYIEYGSKGPEAAEGLDNQTNAS
jgi:hypothetical protein